MPTPQQGFVIDGASYSEDVARMVLGKRGPISRRTLDRYIEKGLRFSKIGEQRWFSGLNIRLFIESYGSFHGDEQ